MLCPECGAEYRPGFYQCTDCDVPLVHELPPDAPKHRDAPADSVIVFESAVPGETDMVAAALEEAGIVGVIRRSIAGGLQLGILEPGLTPGQAYSLSVPRFSESQARELIESFRPTDPSASVVGNVGEGEGAYQVGGASRPTKAVARAILLLMLLPLGVVALALIATTILALLK